jgi:hypothetical protein
MLSAVNNASPKGERAMPRLTAKEWVLIAGIAACSTTWYAVGQAIRALF